MVYLVYEAETADSTLFSILTYGSLVKKNPGVFLVKENIKHAQEKL